MKIASFFLVVFFGIFTLCSCEKLEELTTVKIPISSSRSFEIKNIKVSPSSNGLNTFGATEIVGFSSLEGLKESERNNLSHVTKMKFETGSITIISDDGSGSVVEDFVLESDGISPNLNISQCALGVPYTEGVGNYLDKLVKKIISDGDRNIRVSGNTDIQAGKTMTVKITIDGIVLYVQVID